MSSPVLGLEHIFHRPYPTMVRYRTGEDARASIVRLQIVFLGEMTERAVGDFQQV